MTSRGPHQQQRLYSLQSLLLDVFGCPDAALALQASASISTNYLSSAKRTLSPKELLDSLVTATASGAAEHFVDKFGRYAGAYFETEFAREGLGIEPQENTVVGKGLVLNACSSAYFTDQFLTAIEHKTDPNGFTTNQRARYHLAVECVTGIGKLHATLALCASGFATNYERATQHLSPYFSTGRYALSYLASHNVPDKLYLWEGKGAKNAHPCPIEVYESANQTCFNSSRDIDKKPQCLRCSANEPLSIPALISLKVASEEHLVSVLLKGGRRFDETDLVG